MTHYNSNLANSSVVNPRLTNPRLTNPSLARLRWRLRRGTKELDIIFERLLAQELESLQPDALDSLQQLVELPDPQILALLKNPHTAQPPYTASIKDVLKRGFLGNANCSE